MRPPSVPEVLAPAGDLDALQAALAAGADAVYFGLREGFNARARAGNFALADLAATVARVHRAGARAHLAVNTLVFESELDVVERVVRRAAEAGVDALIVQDPAVAVLARAICPALPVHASTQMTISSREGAAFAASLGAARIVVPRELSIDEIRRLAAGTDLELEVFIHGALCVAWSGQCLTSEAWGGRSANRGQCAQSCRLPYALVLDGEVRDLGDVAYLLSPKDLAGLRAVADLAALGVRGLKIEGRQKGAAYVATATAAYRHWVDAVTRPGGARAADVTGARDDLLRTSLVYTRGFGDGFLGGSDHQTLVEGRFPKHRGVFLGRVATVGRGVVTVVRDASGRPWTGGRASAVAVAAPLGAPAAALHGLDGAAVVRGGPRAAALDPRPGMGIVFDAGHPEDPREPGGPVFAVEPIRDGWVLRFGRPGPDLARVAAGDRVWVTSDPTIAREAAHMAASGEPTGRVPVALVVEGRAGAPLRVVATAGHARAEATTAAVLRRAAGEGLTPDVLRDKLAAFGGTPFALATVDCGAGAAIDRRERSALDGCARSALDVAGLAPGLHVPVSELKRVRRALVAALLPAVECGPAREVRQGAVAAGLRAAARRVRPSRWVVPAAPELVALCRSAEQLEAVIAGGARAVELDWMELVGLGRAVARARAAGLHVTLATVRVQKPGEEGYDRRLAALAPDAVLVRHWGALVAFQGLAPGAPRPLLHGDFSLNVANSITAAELFARGLDTLTPSYDLDRAQLGALLDAAPAERFTVVLHHRVPTFHTEHCVYAHLLSGGRDYRTCGRPCERHEVALRDHTGRTHPVIVDVGCRNTVFNGELQSAAELAPELVARGVRRFRVELVRETREETAGVLAAYADLLAGRIGARACLARVAARPHYGVSTEPMALMR
ncbi:MAG: U32 family peptidase [Deltaproteobacteria bacterium]|nr:U32 family peptidase [Deltaproteobacteria bacterium]